MPRCLITFLRSGLFVIVALAVQQAEQGALGTNQSRPDIFTEANAERAEKLLQRMRPEEKLSQLNQRFRFASSPAMDEQVKKGPAEGDSAATLHTTFNRNKAEA